MPFRQLVPATNDPHAIHPDLKAHLDAVATHWPGLRAALDHGLIVYSSYQAGLNDGRHLFAVLAGAAEDLRDRRRTHGNHVCALVAVHTPGIVDIAEHVLDVPHWIIAAAYAPVGVVIHRALGGDTHDAIPAVPVSFYLIRPWAPADWPTTDCDPPIPTPAATDDGREVLPPGPVHDQYLKLLRSLRRADVDMRSDQVA